MADEQDVFISGISGSIQQWSTEATAMKMEAILSKISASNSAMTQLLTAIKNGEGMTQKQLSQAVNATKTQTKATNRASKKESQDTTRTHGILKGLSQTFKDGWNGSTSGIIDQMRKSQIEASRLERDTQVLLKAGMSREDAAATVKTEARQKSQADFFKKAAMGIIGLIASAEEATLAGYEERFDMASEIRQSGLMSGLENANTGFISIAQTISETGFTFGQAAEFTSKFSEAVGVKGVKGTLDFVNQMARGPGGIIEKFNLEFGQVAHIAGEYIDSLRIGGQLRNRDEAQMRIGMDGFMSTVTATSNVLKVSMTEAATILKNSLSDEQSGMLATLPKEMRMAVEDTARMAGGMDNPIMKLIAVRLSAGEGNFMQTQEFQEAAGTMGGQKLIEFANEASKVLEIEGRDAFRTYIATEGVQFSKDLIALFSDPANKAVGIASGDIGMIGRTAEGLQNLEAIDAGERKGTLEDDIMIENRDQKLQAEISKELSINTLMPGFIENVKDLTNTNRRFAEQAAKTITANANVIDGMNNAATQTKQTVVGLGTIAMKILNIPSMLGDGIASIFGTSVFSNDNKSVMDFTSLDDGGGLRTISNNQNKQFASYSQDMIKEIKNNTEADIEERRAAAAQLKATLVSLQMANVKDPNAEDDIRTTQTRLMASLNALISELKGN